MEKTNNNVIIATHNGNFHADDIFAVATLSLALEQKNKDVEIEIIRTRDSEKINRADYVVDVGSVYDESKNRFDHHQQGGAGKRDDNLNGDLGIPYSSIGLVWKTYGEELCGSKEVMEGIDKRLIQPIDAKDNGIDITEDIHSGPIPYQVQDIVRAFRKTWKEDIHQLDVGFAYLLDFMKELLKREIKLLKDINEAKVVMMDIYNNTLDKRLLILDKYYPFEVLRSYIPDTYLLLYPHMENSNWCVESVEEEYGRYNQKILFPASWAGKSDEELEKVTGVLGSIFCHNRRFLVVAKTKEAAIQLAQMTLNQ